ncbi:hypothetical protein OM076_00665 [Solirubrobacter ginsenosidimutans]|uniref:Uncharacterized protein n=1 Tax=Solirubrobacter ginsenosidimutans TaxID=490573 RepID=A0A9X3RY45_9ACTN|nr:hypothetical protein [Solirubrobacter ginsenosidimutans]MDA0158759.1 hypothetical protein [Solirubrobacter ginsenosidimutans]
MERPGRVALLAALATAAALAVQAPTHAAQAEYTPDSHAPHRHGPPCRAGYEINAAQQQPPLCFKRCRAGYARLDYSRESRVACVRRRASRLWYRAELDVDFHQSTIGLGGPIETFAHQRWTFRSSRAAIVFRQCSVAGTRLPPETARDVADVPAGGAIACDRVEPALLASADLVEDASFSFAGEIKGSEYEHLTRHTTPMNTTWRNPDESIGKIPCLGQVTIHVKGAGPERVAAGLRANGLSAVTGGLALASGFRLGDVPGSATETTLPIVCPPAPPGAITPHVPADLGRTIPAPVRTVLGSGTVAAFKPDVGARFGRPNIDITKDVEAEGSHATITLRLTRCPRRGRSARGC